MSPEGCGAAPAEHSCERRDKMLASVLIATTGGGRLEDIVRTYLGNPTAHLEVIVIVDNPGQAAFLAPFRSDGR